MSLPCLRKPPFLTLLRVERNAELSGLFKNMYPFLRVRIFFLNLFLVFLGSHLRHMEVHRPGGA